MNDPLKPSSSEQLAALRGSFALLLARAVEQLKSDLPADVRLRLQLQLQAARQALADGVIDCVVLPSGGAAHSRKRPTGERPTEVAAEVGFDAVRRCPPGVRAREQQHVVATRLPAGDERSTRVPGCRRRGSWPISERAPSSTAPVRSW